MLKIFHADYLTIHLEKTINFKIKQKWNNWQHWFISKRQEHKLLLVPWKDYLFIVDVPLRHKSSIQCTVVIIVIPGWTMYLHIIQMERFFIWTCFSWQLAWWINLCYLMLITWDTIGLFKIFVDQGFSLSVDVNNVLFELVSKIYR